MTYYIQQWRNQDFRLLVRFIYLFIFLGGASKLLGSFSSPGTYTHIV